MGIRRAQGFALPLGVQDCDASGRPQTARRRSPLICSCARGGAVIEPPKPTSTGFAFASIVPHLYLQKFPVQATDEELTQFLSHLEQSLPAFERPYAWLVDLRDLATSTSTQRRIYAEFDQRVADQDRAHCAGVALVISNPLTRGMVTAVHWITPPVYPHTTAATLSRGVHWLCDRLRQRKVEVNVPEAVAKAESVLLKLKVAETSTLAPPP